MRTLKQFANSYFGESGIDMIRYMIYLLTAFGLTSGGTSTAHIYTNNS